MKKNGFAFVEIIITVVVLCTTLLLLYSTYSSILSDENSRLYYDDPAFIYKTNYVKEFLTEHTAIKLRKDYLDGSTSTYTDTIGIGVDSLFNDSSDKSTLNNIVEAFKIKQIVLVKSDMFDNCVNPEEDEKKKCENSLENLNYNLQKYINTLNDTSHDFYLVVEYSIKDSSNEKCDSTDEKKCKSYYASLPI